MKKDEIVEVEKRICEDDGDMKPRKALHFCEMVRIEISFSFSKFAYLLINLQNN